MGEDDVKQEYVSPQAFAKVFGVAKMTVYRAIQDGTVTAIRVGGQWRIPITEIDRVKKEGM